MAYHYQDCSALLRHVSLCLVSSHILAQQRKKEKQQPPFLGPLGSSQTWLSSWLLHHSELFSCILLHVGVNT